MSPFKIKQAYGHKLGHRHRYTYEHEIDEMNRPDFLGKKRELCAHTEDKLIQKTRQEKEARQEEQKRSKT